MNEIIAWVLCISVASIVGGLVRVLAPNGNVQTALHTAVGVFLIACFLLPLLNLKTIDWSTILEFNAAYESNQTLADTVTQQTEFAVQDKVREIAEGKVRECGAQAVSIAVDVENAQEGINVTEIRAVILDTEPNLAEKVKKALEAAFDVPVQVAAEHEIK